MANRLFEVEPVRGMPRCFNLRYLTARELSRDLTVATATKDRPYRRRVLAALADRGVKP